ncbi:MAG: MBL fold metallo-hydrolase [Thermodesulfobacteriota bacterium]|nr:MBL fold metallo-hydrolase [Thermodesulfobacteriota bacterium]
MRPSFIPKLVNGPLFDPIVHIRILNERGAIMFDCGRFLSLPVSGGVKSVLTNREILLLNAIFISHAHMDHFMGFDHVLRVILHRQRPLHIYGPEGITDKVLSKLHAYTWNLTGEYMLEVYIHEIRADTIITSKTSARTGFNVAGEKRALREDNIISREPRYTVEAVILEHNTPCLGFIMKERLHVNIKGDMLLKKGYLAGPWIGMLKELVLTGAIDTHLKVDTSSGVCDLLVEDIVKDIVIVSPGQKIVYVTDIRYSRDNLEKIMDVASGTDILFIEAFYLDELKDQAYKKGHLTAAQAGRIAQMIGAKKVIPMHISPRYHSRVDSITKEIFIAHKG